MKQIKERLGYIVLVVAIMIAGLFGVQYPRPAPMEFEPQAAKVADFIIPTTNPTATPGVVIDNKSAGADSLWVSAASTPVVKFSRAGNIDSEGDGDFADDVIVADTLDVNGDIDLDGDGFDVNITGGASIDADTASNLNAAAGDITIEAETGSLILKADEGVADAVKIDANDAVTSGVDIDIGSSGEVAIDGGLVDIGGGTYGTANGDNDLGVAGDIEVEGNVVMASGNYPVEFASAARIIYVGSTSAFTGTVEIAAGTHGCSTAVAFAMCQMQNPDDDAGDAFLCVASISGTTVTIGAMDTAGDAATEADVVADYIILGN